MPSPSESAETQRNQSPNLEGTPTQCGMGIGHPRLVVPLDFSVDGSEQFVDNTSQ